MSLPIRTCFLFDKHGQQAGPYTVAEALRLVDDALAHGPYGRRLSVWSLGWPGKLAAPLAQVRLRRLSARNCSVQARR